MIAYLLAGAFALGLAIGGGGMSWWNGARDAARERDLAEAQAKVDELVAQTRVQAQQSLEAERQAYIAGEANAKVISKRTYEQGKTYAATNTVLTNPQCFIPADGLQLLVSARTGTQPPAAPSGSVSAVSGTGGSSTGQTGRGTKPVGDVPADAQGRGSGSGMPTQAGNAGGNGQVSGAGTGRVRPKPKPIE